MAYRLVRSLVHKLLHLHLGLHHGRLEARRLAAPGDELRLG